MDSNELPHILFRWAHVVAGVMWIGQIWSLAVVHRWLPVEAATSTVAGSVLRAHNWVRWAAILTWFTGFALLGIVYYGGGALTYPDQSFGVAAAAGIVSLFLGFGLYDAVWRLLDRHRTVAVVMSLALFTAAAAALSRVMTGRAVFIHLGAMLGTIMVANVWQRIWPIERRRLSGRSAGPQPSAGEIETAALRLRHNAAIAVAVILLMVSNHFPLLYGHTLAWMLAPAIVIAAALCTWLCESITLRSEPALGRG